VAARLASLLGVLLVAAGCAAPGSAAPQSFTDGSTVRTMNFGGLDRSYRVWRNVDGCAPPATTTDGAVTTSTAGCPDGRSVVLVTVDGGRHEWPSFATPALWQFFAAHPG
jgi:hypothetical protein